MTMTVWSRRHLAAVVSGNSDVRTDWDTQSRQVGQSKGADRHGRSTGSGSLVTVSQIASRA